MRIAVYLPLAILAVLSAPFVVSDLDLALHSSFYDSASQSWPVGEAPIWRFFYTVGPVPGILLGAASAILLLLGLGIPQFAKFRKLSAYFFFVLLIGSGLITNALMKDLWGRPRPKQVTAFDGTEEFERLLHYEPESTGKSFPCGHATMGFFFFAFVPLTRGWRRWWWLLFALLFGILIGVARIAQGGHFTSDVLWAAAVMWFTSLAFFKLFKMDRSLWWVARADAKAPPKWLPWVSTPVVLVLLALAGTIWPYDKEISATPSDIPELSQLLIDFNGEDIVEVVPGKEFTITCFTDGHRAPKSRLRPTSTFTADPPTVVVDFERKGFFSELNVRTVITIPATLDLTLVGDEELTRVVVPQSGLSPQLELSPETKVIRR